jgi:hypothetical protein
MIKHLTTRKIRDEDVWCFGDGLHPAAEGDGFSAVVRWDVYGSINHWEHIHYRCNSYKAKITSMPKGEYWIITHFGLMDEERII